MTTSESEPGFEAGDLVLVPFPFADLETTKQRPALVLFHVVPARLPGLLGVAMVTSRMEAAEIAGDCPIEGFTEAGLLRPSKVRLAKLVTIETALVRKRLGAVTPADRQRLGEALMKLLGAWI